MLSLLSASVFSSDLHRQMTQRHPYHSESHTPEGAENLHHAQEVQNVLLDLPQSPVFTSMSTEGLRDMQPPG